MTTHRKIKFKLYFLQHEINKLTKENKCLKIHVEKLKFDLECIRVQNGGMSLFGGAMLYPFYVICNSRDVNKHFECLQE